MKDKIAVFIGSLALAGLAVQADGAVVFDSLSTATSEFGRASGVGASFSTGAAGGALSDVKLLMTGNPTSYGSFTVALYSDSVAGPGASLAAITTSPVSDASVSSSPTVVDFPLGSPFALQADSRYWVVISGLTTVNWGFTRDTSGTGVLPEYLFVPNPPYDFFWGELPNQAISYALQMQVSVAPEPSTMLAGVSGVWVAAVALVGKRRQQRA